MRWPWSSAGAPATVRGVHLADDGELEAPEVVEIDPDGAWLDATHPTAAESPREVSYALARDATGVAGIWATIAER